MKSGRAHRVPLSPAALAVLDTVTPFRDGRDVVFPPRRGRIFGATTPWSSYFARPALLVSLTVADPRFVIGRRSRRASRMPLLRWR